MKKIEAIIRISKLDVVRQSLHSRGVDGLTVTEVQGARAEKGRTINYRGAQSDQHFVPRIKLETIVDDDDADQAVDAIYYAAYTGDAGDGLITVTELGNVVRIRTGEAAAAFHAAAV